MVDDDAALLAACDAVRAAVAAYNVWAEQNEPGDLSTLYERERLALECVAASRARTPAGIAAKALLLRDCEALPEWNTRRRAMIDKGPGHLSPRSWGP
jgi:hypothetical protein